MIVRFLSTLAIAFAIVSITVAATQITANDERRAAITVLRAINTAENAVMQQTGRYVPLAQLIDHPMMARVKPNITVNGTTFTHAGAEVRVALSSDATQYVVTVVSGAPAHNAAFTDERGLIYTGQVLQ